MSEWKDFKIGEKCIVGDGAHASIKRVDKGIPYLTSKNFKQEGIDLSDLSFISKSDYEKHFRANSKALTKPSNDDLIISIIGSIGAPYLVRESDNFGISSSVAIIRPSDEVDSKYLFYYLKTSGVQNYVEAIKSGSAQGFLSIGMIKSIPLKYPSPKEQHRIASILSAYDELIENNMRRIAILEQTAEQIYKEWFVRMCFPGYENTEFEKGVPKGWEIKPISTLCSKITDGTHDTPKPVEDGGIPLITGTHIKDGQIDFNSAYQISIDDHIKIKKRSYLDKGDILYSNIGTIGSMAIVKEDFEYSVKNMIIFKPLEVDFSLFLFFMIKSPTVKEQLQLDSSGTSQKFITLGYIRKLKALIPNNKLIKKFSQFATPIIIEQSNLQQQNQNLTQTRDLLLPRLISGKLKVSER